MPCYRCVTFQFPLPAAPRLLSRAYSASPYHSPHSAPRVDQKFQEPDVLCPKRKNLEKIYFDLKRLFRIGGRRRREQQRTRWLDGITNTIDMGLGRLRSSWWTGRPGVQRSMWLQRIRHDWVTELNWTPAAAWNSEEIMGSLWWQSWI